MKALLLNASYEPLQVVTWQKAIGLVVTARAEIVASHKQRAVRTVHSRFPMPSVVRLTRYVKVFRRFGRVKCTRRNILLRDRGRCQYCGRLCSGKEATIDHVVPRARGGKTVWKNVVLACKPCNGRKGSRSVRDCGMKLLRKPFQPGWLDLSAGREKLLTDWRAWLSPDSS